MHEVAVQPGTPTPVVLRPDARTRWVEDGRALLGGDPARLWRLSDAGVAHVRALLDGQPTTFQEPLVDRLVATGMAHPLPVDCRLGGDDVAVVVPFHGAQADLDQLLGALDPRWTVIVVDDASPLPLSTSGARTRLVRHEVNRGPAAARNTGWRMVGTPLVAFVDGDTVPEADWIDRLAAHLVDPHLAVVAPRITTDGGTGVTARADAIACPLDMGPEGGLVRPETRRPYVPSAALLVRRAALEAVNGFDEALRVGEDVDLVWRLTGSGWRVRYVPEERVRHRPREDVAGWLRQRVGYGRSSALLWERHPQHLRHLDLPWRVALPWVAAAAVGAVGPVGPAARRAAGALAVGALATGTIARSAVGGRRPVVEGGLAIATYLRRITGPLLLALAPWSALARRLTAAALVPLVAQWWRTTEERSPVALAEHLVVHLVDDCAYAAGGWAGALQRRTLRPLLPAQRSPPRRIG